MLDISEPVNVYIIGVLFAAVSVIGFVFHPNFFSCLRAACFFSGFHTHQFGLDPTAIKAFPLFQYSKVQDLEIGRGVTMVECAICLAEFEEGEMLRLLPKCNDVFHQQCIDKWFARHVTCPVCLAILSPETDADCRPNCCG